MSNKTGMTLVELVVVMAVLSVLASVAMPMYRISVKRTKEIQLRTELRDMREAIDTYKRYADLGMIQKANAAFNPGSTSDTGYPPTLDALTQLINLNPTAPQPGQPVAASPKKIRLLRRIPIDPMTGDADWGLRSNQDSPTSDAWGGQDVFDVYSKSDATALDGTKYKDW